MIFNISMKTASKPRAGFTLIELSIVLVIIGLIVGGVLVGQDLIRAAGVRATVTQIEKYNTAVNTFRGKFGYLPGDINATAAAQFGFAARGILAGQGDGNGVLQGDSPSGWGVGLIPFSGETEMFWVDLSKADLVDGSFTNNCMTALPAFISATGMGQYMPEAKIGGGNYIYVWSGGWSEISYYNNGQLGNSDGNNYFGLSVIMNPLVASNPASNVGLTVSQAYGIDKKMDDGMPQSGRVMAVYPNDVAWWAANGNLDPDFGQQESGDFNTGTGGPAQTGDFGDATSAGPNSCYDASSGSEQYSMQINSGAGINCVLSIRFQ